MRKAFGNFAGSIRLSTTQGCRFGVFARAMIGVTARDSPELVGPQMACTFAEEINSWVALTAGVACLRPPPVSSYAAGSFEGATP
jgi:hypothetical protein